MALTSTSTKIGTNLLLEILEDTPSTQNIMLMGKHGIGKSQILEQFYTSKGCKVVTLFLGQMSDPGDLIGIPHKNEATGKTDFMPPYWFPLDNQPVVLFLDELNRARPEVLQTIMDLALNRKLAGRSLPEGSRIISAINNGDEYQLTELDPALVSRFNIYEFVPTVSEWLKWAENSGIDERIIKFIDEKSDMLDSPSNSEDDFNSLEKTPDRRGWQKVSELIKGKNTLKESYKKMIAGIIGKKAAADFYEFTGKATVLSGKEFLLGNFQETKNQLEKYTTVEYAFLNNSIFSFLEDAKLSPKDTKLCAVNMQNYFDFLNTRKLDEAEAHFANLFTNPGHPNAIAFIIEDCDDLYVKITKFVSGKK